MDIYIYVHNNCIDINFDMANFGMENFIELELIYAVL